MAEDESVVYAMSQSVKKVERLRGQISDSEESLQIGEIHKQMTNYFQGGRNLLTRSISRCSLGDIPEILPAMEVSVVFRSM